MGREINFNKLYEVDSIISGLHFDTRLYKDKKQYYLMLLFYNNKYFLNDTLFFKISINELLNLLRKKINLVSIIDTKFNETNIFKVKEEPIITRESLTEESLIPISYLECKLYFNLIDDINNYHFSKYVYYLEKTLNSKVRKEHIKKLLKNAT